MSDFTSVLNVDRLDPVDKPFPHATVDGFLEPTLFAQLSDEFPAIMEMDRPKNWGAWICRGDEPFETHMEKSPAWKKFADAVFSQSYLDFIIGQFGDRWEREGCKIDLSKAVYVPYIENREDKGRGELREVKHDPHELYLRMDIGEAQGGYYRSAHLDHRRRLTTMLVYFSDKREIGMEGGELLLHPGGPDLSMLRAMGVFHAPKALSKMRDKVANTVKVEPAENRMAMFLCGRRSWHAVPAVTSSRAPRRWVHLMISSSVDAWK